MRLYLNKQSGQKRLENVRSNALSEHRPPDRSARCRRMIRLDPATTAKLVDGYQAGACANELATQFGIHRHTVAEVLKRKKSNGKRNSAV